MSPYTRLRPSRAVRAILFDLGSVVAAFVLLAALTACEPPPHSSELQAKRPVLSTWDPTSVEPSGSWDALPSRADVYHAFMATSTTSTVPVPTPSEPVAATPPSVGGPSSGGVAAFLACTRAHESDTAGGYRAVSPSGTYRGAYQFHQTTWNTAAVWAGRPDLVGVLPDHASPADQDTVAAALYRRQGAAPWGGRCG